MASRTRTRTRMPTRAYIVARSHDHDRALRWPLWIFVWLSAALPSSAVLTNATALTVDLILPLERTHPRFCATWSRRRFPQSVATGQASPPQFHTLLVHNIDHLRHQIRLEIHGSAVLPNHSQDFITDYVAGEATKIPQKLRRLTVVDLFVLEQAARLLFLQ